MSVSKKEVKFEGLTEDEILSLSKEEVDALVLVGEPVVFRAGSATILGNFKRRDDRLVLELAQIEGGGEGVLVSLASLSNRYAKMNGLKEIEWIVHAVTCAKPNPKLRRVLERRGFAVQDVDGVGNAYHLVEST
jgi:hypothetical protein